MQLAWGNWPPFLSHLIMVVLGMGLHHIFSPARTNNLPKMRTNRFFVTLPKKMQLYGEIKKKNSLGFIIKARGEERCRVSWAGVHLHHIYRKNFVISLSGKKMAKIIRHLQEKSLEGIFTKGDQRAQKLNVCVFKPTVVYGTH